MKPSSEEKTSQVNDEIMESGRSANQLQTDGDESQMLNLVEKKKPALNSYVLACALLASLSSALLGYGT